MGDIAYSYRYEEDTLIGSPAMQVFTWLDDPRHLAAHMNRSSTMMAGGSMCLFLDEKQGKKIGAHIRMRGRMLGLPLELDEVVTERDPPVRKVWETVDEPTLWVLGNYRMGANLKDLPDGCSVSVFIEYNLPASPWLQPLAYWMSRPYAAWCVDQMLAAIRAEFAHSAAPSVQG